MTVAAQSMAVEPAEPNNEHLIGSVINGKYRLLRLLGAGGMGAVYEAEDPMLRRRVALKLMKESIATHDGLVQRFVREARAADSIQHPNIVRIVELARDNATQIFYIVQELLIGENLSEKLEREGRLSCEEALSIMAPILDALGAAHNAGILHRDVKPDNVFLHQDPRLGMVPKLIDFGISKMSEAQPGLSKTQTGTAMGTPYYMSPEQVRGDSNIDARADLWSAAIMMFELITGRPPFRGENYNILILRIMTDRAPTALSMEPSVSSEVSAVLERALEPVRDQRYASAAELKYALQQAVQESKNRLGDRRSTIPLVQLARSAPKPVSTAEIEVVDTQPETINAVASTNAYSLGSPVDGHPTRDGTESEPSASPTKPKRSAILAGISLFVLVSIASVVRFSMRQSSTEPQHGTTPIAALQDSQDSGGASIPSEAVAHTDTPDAQLNAVITQTAAVANNIANAPPVVGPTHVTHNGGALVRPLRGHQGTPTVDQLPAVGTGAATNAAVVTPPDNRATTASSTVQVPERPANNPTQAATPPATPSTASNTGATTPRFVPITAYP